MRQLGILLHLIVTAWAAYIAPIILLVGVAGYFPGYPHAAYTATYVAMVLAGAFLGGTILGRAQAWRGRVILLSCLSWVLALIDVVPTMIGSHLETPGPDDLVAPIVFDLGVVLWAFGLTVGLFVGARFMRQYGHTLMPPDTSLERTREE
jgi:hypothetical protein